MAIISCPFCHAKISDKTKICSHCDGDLYSLTSEQIASKHKVSRIHKSQSIQVQTFLALMLFVGGFTLWYWDDRPGESWFSVAGQGMIVFGFVWYVVNRARLMLHNRG